MRTILLSLAALMATPGLLLGPISSSGTATAQQNVTIESGSDYFCDPSFFGAVCETTVNAGDTVTWNNVQGVHTVTECDATHTVCPPAGGGFDSGILTQGATFSHTFAAPGIFNYYCAVHPDTMQGRIIVLQVTPSPAPTNGPTAVPTAAATVPGATATTAPASTVQPHLPSTGGDPGSGGTAYSLAAITLGSLAIAIAAVGVATASRRL